MVKQRRSAKFRWPPKTYLVCITIPILPFYWNMSAFAWRKVLKYVFTVYIFLLGMSVLILTGKKGWVGVQFCVWKERVMRNADQDKIYTLREWMGANLDSEGGTNFDSNFLYNFVGSLGPEAYFRTGIRWVVRNYDRRKFNSGSSTTSFFTDGVPCLFDSSSLPRRTPLFWERAGDKHRFPPELRILSAIVFWVW